MPRPYLLLAFRLRDHRNCKRSPLCGRSARCWLRQLHELPVAWVVVSLQSGRIVDGGRLFKEMIQAGRSEFLMRSVADFTGVMPAHRWATRLFDKSLIAVEGRHEDVVLKSTTGVDMLVDVHISHPTAFRRRRVAVCLVMDSTERQRLQSALIVKHQELRRAFLALEQKSADLLKLNGEIGEMSAMLSQASSLAALGELTAELTHQLNNPLAAAISTARRIEVATKSGTPVDLQPMLTLLNDSLGRLKDTMNELKRVYRNTRAPNAALVPIDLRAQLESALMLLQTRLGAVQVRMRLASDIPTVVGRPSEIQHVLVNLIDNALQAISNKGVIEIGASRDGERVRLSIGDSGPGIPFDQRERVFEPFFTTREHGSGLGLSVVRRSVKSNRATIRVGQSPLGGAEFEIGFMTETD